MKRIISVIILIFAVFITFSTVTFSSENTYWTGPKSIKTYIPQHKRTVMMKHAFKRWSKATNNKVIFQYVDSPQKADVKVYFVNKIPNADREIGLTRTKFRYADNSIVNADIYIAEKTPYGVKLRDDSVFTVMIHEIGHALGIGQHSTDPASIMYPVEDDRQEILKSDIQTLAKIYGW